MDILHPARLPAREPDSHKGDYGRVLVVAGSLSYPGAALLAALGAGCAGAGYVHLATVEPLVNALVPAVPFAIPCPLPTDAEGGPDERGLERLRERAADCDVVVLGPGLGTSDATARLLEAFLLRHQGLTVLDADALNLLALGDPRSLRERRGPTVLTPHPGEWRRLAERLELLPVAPEAGRDERRLEEATALARALGVIVVLKGHRTVVSDGNRERIEPAGHPAMAKAGTGDVLAGALGALLARIPDAAEAAALAVRVHALAGERAAERWGAEGLLPQELARQLGLALEEQQRSPDPIG